LRKKGTTQNYVFLKHVPQLTTGLALKNVHKHVQCTCKYVNMHINKYICI